MALGRALGSALASALGSALVEGEPTEETYVAPYDDYTTSLKAAYGLRKLLTAYTGSIVRVRRSLDDAEQDFGPDGTGCSLNLPAIMAFLDGNNGFVSKWYDQSGNGFHVSEATKSRQPRLVLEHVVETAGANLVPAVRFLAASETRLSSAAVGTTAQPHCTITLLHTATNSNTTGAFISDVVTANNQHWNNGGSRSLYSQSAATSGSWVTNHDEIWCTKASGATSILRVNGSAATINPGTGTPNGFRFGSWGTEGVISNQFFNGSIAECLFYSADVSSNFAAIEGVMNTYAGAF